MIQEKISEVTNMIKRWGDNPVVARYTIHAVIGSFVLGFLLGVLL